MGEVVDLTAAGDASEDEDEVGSKEDEDESGKEVLLSEEGDDLGMALDGFK